jgi:STE24 endopeptidase
MFELPWKPLYTQSGGDAAASITSTESLFGQYAMAATIVFTVLVYTFEGSLDARQKRAYQKTAFPKELEQIVSAVDREQQQQNQKSDKKENDKKGEQVKEENKEDDKNSIKKDQALLPQLQAKFRSAQAYGSDKIRFGMIASAYDVVESIVFLLVGFLPYTWDLAATTGNTYFGWTVVDNEIKISLLFLCIITLVGTVTSLPFELYSTFEIERKHGFNKQTLGLFVSDKVKSLLLTMIIGGPFVALLLSIIQWGGPYFYLYVWAFLFVFSATMMTLVPVFIMPLFNKYEPLEDGTLKTKIFELAGSLNYPLTKLFVMDGSKRSSHSNAFMFGFGNNKRIVLFDTLMTQVHQDEILAILGHELGHWKLGHTLLNFAVTQAYFGLAFYFFSLAFASHDLYAAFGFTSLNKTPTVVTLLLFFQTLWAPVDKMLSFGLTIVSRLHEFAADRFAAEVCNMSKSLQSGLCKIHLENLGAMCPDPWYSTYHYSHPPLVERLAAMMKFDQERKVA